MQNGLATAGSSLAKKRRSVLQKAGDSELSDSDGDFKHKHNPFFINGRNAAAIDAPDQLAKAAKSHDAYQALCATTYARYSLSAPPYLFAAPNSFPTRSSLSAPSAPPFFVAPDCAERRIPRQRSKLPHRDGQPTKQQRIEPSAEPEPCGTNRTSLRLVGSTVNYAPESAAAFARRVGAGETEANQQRLAKLARGDGAGNSASDDDESASEVCLPFPPDRWLVGTCVLCERDDAGAGRVAKIRGVRIGRVGRVGRDVVGWWC
jgi:hypothetical protein